MAQTGLLTSALLPVWESVVQHLETYSQCNSFLAPICRHSISKNASQTVALWWRDLSLARSPARCLLIATRRNKTQFSQQIQFLFRIPLILSLLLNQDLSLPEEHFIAVQKLLLTPSVVLYVLINRLLTMTKKPTP